MKTENKNKKAEEQTREIINREEWITRAVAAATIGRGKRSTPGPVKTESDKD